MDNKVIEEMIANTEQERTQLVNRVAALDELLAALEKNRNGAIAGAPASTQSNGRYNWSEPGDENPREFAHGFIQQNGESSIKQLFGPYCDKRGWKMRAGKIRDKVYNKFAACFSIKSCKTNGFTRRTINANRFGRKTVMLSNAKSKR